MAAASFVTVASKLSFPLILTVSNGRWEDFMRPDGRPSKVFIPEEVISHTVRGFSAQRKLESGGRTIGESVDVIGGYGITPNIPAEFWDRWLEENNRPGSSFYQMIQAGLIFASPKPNTVVAQAKEQKETKSGTEALIPQTFDRAGNRTSKRDDRIAPNVAALERDGV